MMPFCCIRDGLSKGLHLLLVSNNCTIGHWSLLAEIKVGAWILYFYDLFIDTYTLTGGLGSGVSLPNSSLLWCLTKS